MYTAATTVCSLVSRKILFDIHHFAPSKVSRYHRYGTITDVLVHKVLSWIPLVQLAVLLVMLFVLREALAAAI